MSDYICFLISILDNQSETIFKCALKVKRESLSCDCEEFYMKRESRIFLHSLLPVHIKNQGPIVDIEEIVEVTII